MSTLLPTVLLLIGCRFSVNLDMEMKLEVQIATHGLNGMDMIDVGKYPRSSNVSYRVGWQHGTLSLKPRDDFEVMVNSARCLTENRNILIEAAEDDIVLFADNDISYTSVGLKSVIDAFESHPEVGFICFKMGGVDKKYPSGQFFMNKPPKGYYTSSWEIAVRTCVLCHTGIRFDTRFGLGSRYICCEETVFIDRLIASGVKGMYMPVIIGSNDGGVTTGADSIYRNEVNEAKGAALAVTRRWSGLARLLVRSVRNLSASELIFGLKGYFSVILNV